MVAKLNKIKNWQASIIIAAVGFVVYASGLKNPFQGDDLGQIVNNVPVHSITNIRLFFEGGTFYAGQGLMPLQGVYFRPLMTTAFSLVYTLFGPRPFYFHIFQLLICIGSSFLLYLFFRYSFKPALALFLAIIFLIHPIDSETAFAIPVTQDALYFFFGISALYILVRFKSTRSLIFAALCLLLSLFSKETGVLFLVLSFLYLWWWDRKRLALFASVLVLPIVFYAALRINAVGLFGSRPDSAPIDRLSLGGRLMTAPAIIALYLGRLIFPWKLATDYFWVYPHFSIQHVLIPLLTIIGFFALIIYFALMLNRKRSRAAYCTYLFFGIWFVIGLLFILQIFPLDTTASEAWFYFPMAGLLGMIGVILKEFPIRIRPSWILFVVAALIVGTLGLRTAIRGMDWGSTTTLAYKDITASPSDYVTYNLLAYTFINQGNYLKAKGYALESVHLFPTYNNYDNLGVVYAGLGNYAAALDAYKKGLSYGVYNSEIFNNVGELTLVYGNPNQDKLFFIGALKQYPKDSELWTELAIFEAEHNDNKDAQIAIANARQYGQVSNYMYNGIMDSRPIKLNLLDVGKSLYIE